MSVHSSWRVQMGLAAIVLLAAACANGGTPPPKPAPPAPAPTGQGKTLDCKRRDPEHVVLIREGQGTQDPKKKKGVAYPYRLIVGSYDPAAPHSTIIWSFRNQSTEITFERPEVGVPDCKKVKYECELRLPKNLSFETQYKYTISGTDSEGKPFEDNDPFIEVDR